MKKLLSLLGSVSLVLSTSSVAVACSSGDTRISTPTLNEKTAKELIAQLKDNPDFNFWFSDLFSDIDLTSTIVNEVNRLVSVNYSYERTNANLTALGVSSDNLFTNKNDATDKTSFLYRFNKMTQTVAEDELYNEYSKTVVDNTSQALDYSISKQFYALNPIEDTTVTDVNGVAYTVKAGEKIKISGTNDDKVWEVYGESGDTSITESNVPDITQLTQEYKSGSTSPFKVSAVSTDGNKTVTDITISAKTALLLRFQDYFNNKVKKDVMTNALTMVYNEGSLWRISKDSKEVAHPYIDITNPVFSTAQTWGHDSMSTNVKMVWVLTAKDEATRAKIETALGFKSDDGTSLLDADGALVDKTKGIGDIIETIKTAAGTGGLETSKDGNDPYFGLSGYKGVVISKDGTTIGNNPISGAAYESDVNNVNNLKNAGGVTFSNAQHSYKNADNSKEYDFVITLPIYLIQLLGANTALANPQGSKSLQDDATPTANIYSVDDAKGNKHEIQFRRSASSSDVDSYLGAWEFNQAKLSSKDVETIASKPEQQASLFQEIQYLVAQDSNNQESAKKIIYSKYLNADDIYYAGLYDEIGKYITESSSEDE